MKKSNDKDEARTIRVAILDEMRKMFSKILF